MAAFSISHIEGPFPRCIIHCSVSQSLAELELFLLLRKFHLEELWPSCRAPVLAAGGGGFAGHPLVQVGTSVPRPGVQLFSGVIRLGKEAVP